MIPNARRRQQREYHPLGIIRQRALVAFVGRAQEIAAARRTVRARTVLETV